MVSKENEKLLISIDDIKVKKRIRKDLGNLEALKDSLKRYGLMNPITLNSKYELIAGQRRLEAAKQLGWTTIQVNILESAQDKISQLEMELEENTQRYDFSDEELLAGYAALEKLRNPGFFRKLINRIISFFTSDDEVNIDKINRKKEKSFALSFLLAIGMILAIVSSILYKIDFIGSPIHFFIDCVACVMMFAGTIFLVRFLLIRRKYINTKQIQKI